MIDNEIRNLQEYLGELQEYLENIQYTQNRIEECIENIDKKINADYNISFMLDELKEIINSLSFNNVINTIDDIEYKINDLSYNYKIALKAQNNSVYKLQYPNFMYKKS